MLLPVPHEDALRQRTAGKPFAKAPQHEAVLDAYSQCRSRSPALCNELGSLSVLYVAPQREAIPTEAIHTTEETQVIHSVLTFDQQPLQEIVRQLSETFRTDIRIEGDSLKNYHMTATFREGESLTEILDLLKDAGNFTYKKENNTIILTTKLN